MIREISDMREVHSIAGTMPFVYAAFFDKLFLGNNSFQNIDFEKIDNARFFGPTGELRVFRKGDSLCAVWIDDTPQEGEMEIALDRTILLQSRFGESLQVRQHIVFDEDGQAYIRTTRLVSWNGGSIC